MVAIVDNQFSEKKTFFEKIKSIDYILVIIILIIGIISCFVLYSTDGGQFGFHTNSHILKFSLFFILFIILSFVRISFWHALAYSFYFLILMMLIYVLWFGITSQGAQRWMSLYFLNLQPSELMKIAIIVCFARFYHRIQSQDTNKIKNILYPIILLMLPIYLVIAQPDLGTAILIAASGLTVIWLAGVKVRYFIYSFLTLFVSAPFIISFLKPYQKMRILTFFSPERDPLGAGYQILQSKIAVGSGGLFGKGYLKGTQSYLEYLPEKHTDFIFTIFSEEFGFVGSSILLILYFIMLFRIIRIGQLSKSYFAKFYCFGFASALFIYVTVNMSMVLGLLPIVGSPLPIMSYGGSALLSTMIGLAIAMSCKIYDKEIIV
jgi:rod shape determining protein RodA